MRGQVHRDVRDFAHLGRRGFDDLAHSVADARDDGRSSGSVDVSATASVVEVNTFAALDQGIGATEVAKDDARADRRRAQILRHVPSPVSGDYRRLTNRPSRSTPFSIVAMSVA